MLQQHLLQTNLQLMTTQQSTTAGIGTLETNQQKHHHPTYYNDERRHVKNEPTMFPNCSNNNKYFFLKIHLLNNNNTLINKQHTQTQQPTGAASSTSSSPISNSTTTTHPPPIKPSRCKIDSDGCHAQQTTPAMYPTADAIMAPSNHLIFVSSRIGSRCFLLRPSGAAVYC